MNYYIFTGKIINTLKLSSINNKLLVYATLIVPNYKRGLKWYKIVILAKGQIAKNIFQMYQQGDHVLVEGCIYYVKRKKIKNSNKLIFFKINDIHPTSNILNNFI